MELDKLKQLIIDSMVIIMDEKVAWGDSDKRTISIRNTFETEVVESYDINFDSVELVEAYNESGGESGDWYHNYGAIFSFDKGYGLVQHQNSSDYTFTRDEYTLDIHESFDFDRFEAICLTDELRQKFKNTLAEMKLLT